MAMLPLLSTITSILLVFLVATSQVIHPCSALGLGLSSGFDKPTTSPHTPTAGERMPRFSLPQRDEGLYAATKAKATNRRCRIYTSMMQRGGRTRRRFMRMRERLEMLRTTPTAEQREAGRFRSRWHLTQSLTPFLRHKHLPLCDSLRSPLLFRSASIPLKAIRSALFNSTLPDMAPYAPPLNPGFSKFTVEEPIVPTPLDHPVLSVLSSARKGEALPSGTLIALGLEGGGMRGSLSAGMASALSLLDLSPHFSRVYGSSAGSIVGSYLVSRQMCVDVYSDMLPMNDVFLQKRKIIGEIVKSGSKWVRRGGKMVRVPKEKKGPGRAPEAEEAKSKRLMRRLRLRRGSDPPAQNGTAPPPPDATNYDATGMNVSYVLSSVLSSTGLRPFDYLSFHSNSAKQSLNVLSSCSDFTTKSWNGTHYFSTTPSSSPPRTLATSAPSSSLASPPL